jgi:hypothetical protein
MAVESDEPTTKGRIAADAPTGSSGGADQGSGPGFDPIMLDPTDDELEDWAERERQRRQAWLNGPSPEEREAWAQRERMRRLSRLSDEDRDAVMAEWARQMVRYPREMQLAAEGMVSLFYQWSRRQMADFVRAGREWEDQFGRTARRGRVRLDDDED